VIYVSCCVESHQDKTMKKGRETGVGKYILVTGGAGYIGSHIVLSLLESGLNVVVLDDLSNASVESIERVGSYTGAAPFFVKGDICDAKVLDRLFATYQIESVIHCAGVKSVGESVKSPIKYFSNNVSGSVSLFNSMYKAGVFRLVFSSSATVYGDSGRMPLSELTPIATPTNPYGRSKLMVEEILSDMAKADSRWSIATVRYFNPVGAHTSGLIGEDPLGIPNNLVPYLGQVAIGKLAELKVFGNDYPTRDGTGVRDYVHVVDLANGHLKALQAIELRAGFHIWNFGSGKGYSVLELLDAFQAASGLVIPYSVTARRPGDIAECWADVSKAENELGWRAERGLEEMMKDAWRWQKNNPNGYRR